LDLGNNESLREGQRQRQAASDTIPSLEWQFRALTSPTTFQLGTQTQYFLGIQRCFAMTAMPTNIEMPMAAYPEEGGTGSPGEVTAWEQY